MKYLTCCCLVACCIPLTAELERNDHAGFVSAIRLDIAATPEQVYDAFTAQVSSWWDAEHSYSRRAENFSLDAQPGGCFCESLPGGGGIEHLRVLYAAPGVALRMEGALGPLQSLGVQGVMTIQFQLTETGTTLVYRYVVNGPDLQSWAEPVDIVQGGQLQRLKNYVETGTPLRVMEKAAE